MQNRKAVDRRPFCWGLRGLLRELGDSFAAMMYVITTIQGECAVKLPMDELMRINTVGELVDLVRNAPKV